MLHVILLAFIMLFVMIIRISRKSDEDTQQDNSNSPVVEDLKYFCTKDSGYYVSVWPKGQQTGNFLEFDIAGMTYREGIEKYMGEYEGTLEPEPTNPYDANAIKILAHDGHHVGYVPKDMTIRVREFTTLPCKCFFYISNYYDSEGTHYYSDCFIIR